MAQAPLIWRKRPLVPIDFLPEVHTLNHSLFHAKGEQAVNRHSIFSPFRHHPTIPASLQPHHSRQFATGGD